MEKKGHVIREVSEGSIAEEMGIEAGDRLLTVNGEKIRDIFDYQYLVQDDYIEVLVEKNSGEEWLLEIDKDYDEDLGITFENGLMDEYRSCRNKCIFCFIDQMPKGMRETLYFKDDDSRLSFLQGNYVTLTNMSDHDVERIIKYHLSPINISFQTTNPELRCRMLNNRFAGEALKKADRLYEAGITMNGQIVLCRGVNDGEELERSISDLTRYLPCLESVSVVPVGLSRYREGLYPLEPFTREDAEEVLRLIHGWQDKIYAQHGVHFIHASDEWYIMAGQELPEGIRYDGYLQLENGVGMLRLLMDEFDEALEEMMKAGGETEEDAGKAADAAGAGKKADETDAAGAGKAADTAGAADDVKVMGKTDAAGTGKVTDETDAAGSGKVTDETDAAGTGKVMDEADGAGIMKAPDMSGAADVEKVMGRKTVSLATGRLAYPYIADMAKRLEAVCSGVRILVYPVTNDFFGELITVSGLLTGQDIARQLAGRELGDRLLLPWNVLRSGERVFLDDMTVEELESTLQVKVDIVKSSGHDFIEAIVNDTKESCF